MSLICNRALPLPRVLLGILLLATPFNAQGQVLTGTKISDTAGNFTAILEEQDQFGRSVANLGDIDGDGISDLAVGAQGDDDGPGALDRGAIYILLMNSNGVAKSYQKIAEGIGGISGLLDPGDQFGRSIGSIGDLDGDGITDLAVGSNFDDDGGTNRGAVYILFLNSDGTVRSHQKISDLLGNGTILGLGNFDEFGRAIDGLGDIDGDMVPDMVVGSSYDDDGGVNKGAAYILFLNTDGTLKAFQKISQNQGNLGMNLRGGDFFGHAVSCMGDFDGDGVNDLIVGSVLDDDGGENRGAVYLLLLNSDGTVKDRFKVSDTEGGFSGDLDDIDQFGVSVAGIGDIDLDGVLDMAVGAVKDDDGGTMTSTDCGAVYIVLMNADGTVKMQQKISNLHGSLRFNLDTGDWFGSSLSDLGGLPGDGAFQLVVGSRYDDDGGGNFGAVYILHLNPTDLVPPTAEFTADINGGDAPLTVAFSDLSTGDITSFQWNFGDGSFSTLQHPTHTYADVGAFTVSLIAKNSVASHNEMKAGFVATTEPPPIASFSVLPEIGVAPLPVVFEDSSTLNITSWLWDFGDGSTSSVQNPTHVYSAVGTYSVSLTATSAGGSDAVTLLNHLVVGEPEPAASFSAGPTSGEAPLAVSFSDTSTLNINTWMWDFGDGTTSSLSSPTHTYLGSGTYTVSLTVTSSAGIDSVLIADLVSVVEPFPISAFTPSTTTGDIPLEVTFADASTLNISSWLWDLGDGTTSTLQNPSNTYATAGTYVVSLTVTSEAGTDQSSQSIVAVEPVPIAAFTTDITAGLPPLNVVFSDASTLNITSWLWDFGDGTTSTLSSPTHSFNEVGLYTVALTVTSAGGTDTTTQFDQIDVQEPSPVAGFSADLTVGEAPLPVSFSDTSTLNITGWLWDFGDGTTSSLANPTHTYQVAGSFDVILTVTSAGGTDTVTQTALVSVTEPAPSASFLVTNGVGEAPLAVAFADTSTLNISSWLWDFGDGTTSTLSSPSHIYNTGTYTVSLAVTSPAGADMTEMIAGITATEPLPVAAFTLSQAVGDPPLNVSFTDSSTLNVTGWLWNFGDGTTSTLQNPTHTYGLVGLYDVTLTATSAGGSDVLVVDSAIDVTEPAPVAGFVPSVSIGVAPLEVIFADTSTLNISGWAWDLGDGTTSTLQNPSNTYADPGTYAVTLTVSSAGGTDQLTDTLVVNEPAPVAAFTRDVAQGDAPLSVNFTDGSVLNITSWSWDFGDGLTSTEQSPNHIFSTEGTFAVSLTVTSAGGTDSLVLPDAVTVGEPAPAASFAALPTRGDAPLTVVFTDNSTLNITSWLWDFGDGDTSTLSNPTHTYTTVGNYTVVLTVESSAGLALSQRNDLIQVEEPPPATAFTTDITQGPVPLLITFSDQTTGVASSFAWDFGDATTSTLQNPTHIYAAVGTYSVTLTATGIGGSTAETRADLIIADEPAPLAEFSATNTVGFPPLTVSFSDLSTLNITSYAWDFGDGGVSTDANPTHVYDTVGTYAVSLGVTSAGGTDLEAKTALVTVTEPVPVAAFTPSTTRGDKPLVVAFSDESTLNITAWAWNFGDGAVSTLQNPSYTYAAVGTYTVSLDVSSAGGADTLTLTDSIIVEEPPPTALFAADVTIGDPPLLVSFTDATTGVVSGWAWDFGDGVTSALQDATHVYQEVGTYTVSLTATGIGGFNTFEQIGLITITEPVPAAVFSADLISGDAPLAVTFADTSTLNITSWSWDFGDGVTSTLQDPSHVYQPGTYTVALTVTSAGGMDTATAVDMISVAEPLPVAAFSMDVVFGPAPLLVSFADDSTLNITSWAWDFGDGASSTISNPTHVFADPGLYSVSLLVTSAGGSASALITDAISVVDPAPIPGFTATPTTGPAPLEVLFADQTTGSVTSWSWDFGDGSASTLQSPQHTYQDVGTYTVTQTSGGIGGSNELVQVDLIVVIEPAPKAAFTSSATTGEIPLAVTFQDTSTLNITGWLWDFGDGSTSTLASPSHDYTTVGTYSVSLTVSSTGGSDTFTAADLVATSEPAPMAAFVADVSSGDAPLEVVFTDTSTMNITTWSWDFGDGSASTVQNPTHVFAQPGSYTVALTVTSVGGMDVLTRTDLITAVEPAPSAAFSMDATIGIAPLVVGFSDESTLNITSWAWDFGDGTTSTLQDPTHSYSDVGIYTVSLAVTSVGGSDAVIQLDAITVTEPAPIAAFAFDVSSGSAPLIVNFTDSSTLNITSWLWDFGDAETSTVQSPSHAYNDVGTFFVSLTVTSAGGTDTLLEGGLIVTSEPAPVAAFSSDVTQGPLPLTVNFTDSSTLNITSWSWDFSDGTADGGSSIEQNPAHVFNEIGTFTVALTVTSSAGTDTIEQLDYIVVGEPAPVAAFTLDMTTGPAPLAVNFTDASTLNVMDWSWDFGDGSSSSLTDPSHSFTDPGTYSVSLTVTSAGGTDTLDMIDLIVVLEPAPVAAFSAVPDDGVEPLTVQFSDASTLTITSWSWDFGDGTVSALSNPPHIYTSVGVFTVSLTVTSAGGSDTVIATDMITVRNRPPVASFVASPTFGSAPLNVTFTDTSTEAVTAWQWDFGDGFSSTVQHPSHLYENGGSFTVSLSVTGPGGTDSSSEIDYVIVLIDPPLANFDLSPERGFAPLNVAFTDLSQGLVTSWAWDFGDGTTSSAQNPAHAYETTGTYTVALTSTNGGGSTTERKIGVLQVAQPGAFGDGSFEGQTPGAQPRSPWRVILGTGIGVNPTTLLFDQSMPTHGENWLEIGADGSEAALPPSNPLGEGTAPIGAAQVRQIFTFNPVMTHVGFDAAFILDGAASSDSFNDFMSVDISDGTTTFNLYYEDTFSSFPLLSDKYGLPMTETSTVSVDLKSLFPAAHATTIFTLSLYVGNGGDANNPSRGYADSFVFGSPALAVERNGTGLNSMCYAADPPVIASSWSGFVDSSSHGAPQFAVILAYGAPATGPTLSSGEILVDLVSPPIFAVQVASNGLLDVLVQQVPNNLSLVGLTAASQGLILGGGMLEFCNAVDLTVGF